MKSVCVGFKAHQGWINAVAVEIDIATPAPVTTQRIELIDSDDREVREPYHVAGGWDGLERVPRPDDPSAVINRGRNRQIKSAKKRIDSYNKLLDRVNLCWTRAVVLTGRGWLSDDLEHILGSHSHIHVAEGEAIRDATRAALDALKIKHIDQDEKSILDKAGEMLALSGDDCDKYMKDLKPPGAKSWRKEERLVALGAWLNRK